MGRFTCLAVVILAVVPQALRAEDSDAKKVATEILTKGAAQFDKKDAKAMADFYIDDAEVTLTKKESDGLFKSEVSRGRAEIEQMYAKLFEGSKDNATTSRNAVEDARYIGSEILVIQGKFTPDLNGSLTLPFIQVRIRHDGQWKIQRLQLFLLP